MRNFIIPVIVVAVFVVNANADAASDDLVERWKPHATLFFAAEIRALFREGIYETELSSSDEEKLILQVSTEIATCWADAIVQLAKENSVQLEEVFVNPDGVDVESSVLPMDEFQRLTRTCTYTSLKKPVLKMTKLLLNTALYWPLA